MSFVAIGGMLNRHRDRAMIIGLQPDRSPERETVEAGRTALTDQAERHRRQHLGKTNLCLCPYRREPGGSQLRSASVDLKFLLGARQATDNITHAKRRRSPKP
jgi:hypothetical protein